ncbi:helix-turn-helix domain-containing protein [Shewanella acanthi]|uniref:helix-turn-helix domain-containing protein n=1 Tax=Shewanella acanthi TaxID=2864212 RepID=UPI001C65A3E9|nr:helix-turn-helix transcriptional regulator [Shewanella acanthi]QYJ79463.1 helix-turn-helix domain-containing protein [Shewanella acanthi]
MFSVLIKGFREAHALSQEDLAQILLSFSGRESIDITTISRWERGISAPSIANQIYILRKLGIKFTLDAVLPSISSESIIAPLKHRYSRIPAYADKPYRNELPSFTFSISDQLENFLNDNQLINFNKNMYSTDVEANVGKINLSAIEFDSVRIYRFFREQNLVGHLAYAVANTNEVIKLFEGIYQTEFKEAFESELEGKVLVVFSSYASDLALYIYLAKLVTSLLSEQQKIDWYLGYSFINEDWQVHKRLGGKIIYRGEPLNEGGVKIGKTRVKFVICATSVPTLLANPVALLSELELEKDYAHSISPIND